MEEEQNTSKDTRDEKALEINQSQPSENRDDLQTPTDETTPDTQKHAVSIEPKETVHTENLPFNPYTPPMEVHHHGHVHEKKKWKEYLFQFFMLFLAVFCGFLAEYQLEHLIEKDREKQYMKGMLEDLVSDTAALNAAIQFASRITIGLDSLQNNFYDTDNTIANTKIIYRQNTTYLRIISVGFSDQTATQLRNSGGMRLITERGVANAISRYWTGINSMENVIGISERQFDEISEAGSYIFNRKHIIRQTRDSVTKRLDDVLIDPAALLMTNDKQSFIIYANRISRLRSHLVRWVVPFLKRQKQSAESLIHLIKNEYHLK